ncbi:hypothetical protein [Afipia sp. GAS231]|uniref:hypothetical protein n=1 Tax=Afipia sp. GAS231 TaxID=1882747 RepID=UPI00087C3087|nr:hypothetical protein [Afipia sp. GAS231]SDP41147.1 hypothetical protein SAMN05444050_6766 [Afipia sp. GAS231]
MPFKPPFVTEMDLLRARKVVCALAPLKGLSADDAEIVARTVAQSFAEGRQRGFDIAKAELEGGLARPSV